jgi:spore coat polysaccharide biosynthesis protein SpsF
MLPKVLGVIQSRMGSTRLPGKALEDIAGKPILLRIYERLRASKMIGKVVVATTTAAGDDEIELFAKQHKIGIYRGSEMDLVDRFYQTALSFKASVIVRVWGDCAFIDPVIVDKVIAMLMDEGLDYCSNVRPPSYPRGFDVEAFTSKTLSKVHVETTDPFYREYMTDYIFRNPKIYKVGNVSYGSDLSKLNFTIDYPEDLEFAREVYAGLGDGLFHFEDIMRFIDSHPELLKLKTGLERYADYKEGLAKRSLKYDW